MRIGEHENIDRVRSEDFGLFAKDVHLRNGQVKQIGEELLQLLPSAYEAAGIAAENNGFAAAGEMVERILKSCDKRIKTFKP